MQPIRLSIAVPTVPRDPNNLDKDAVIYNAYLDMSKNKTALVVKRNGRIVDNESITTGNYRGIFQFNSLTYYINSGGILASY